MDRETILESLERMREIQFSCWKGYCEYVEEDPGNRAFRELKDNADMNIRVLDRLMEVTKQNDII